MKILFITSLLGTEHGGAEVSTGLLLDKLIAQGYEVQALTTRKVQVDKRLIPISFPIQIPKKLLTLGNSEIDYFLARKIKKQIELLRPDVIHVQDTYILPATVAANKNLKVPIVATIRNNVLDSAWDLMFPKPISTMLKRRNKTIVKALNDVDGVISVSEYIKTELVQRGINGEKIVAIYNLPPTFKNVETQTSEKTDSTVHLFAPGFLASFKGFSVLIKAMKRVVDTNPNVNLTIAGDGPEKKALEKMTSQLQLDSYIRFTGKMPFANLSKLYSSCDIVIFPSIYPEPFGRVALEAMYFGKPVIASRVGGIPEVVENEETGLLVTPDNPEELAASIITLLRDKHLRELFGKKGKAVVQTKFDAEKIINQHLQIYQKVLGEKNVLSA
jgi:glycosyltransferase involved in cell wall biosynthesis